MTKQKTLQQDIEELENYEAVLAIEKIVKLEKEFPGIIKVRLLDHLEVLADSARTGKYGLSSWLEPGVLDHKKNYASIGRHVAEGYVGQLKDKESGRNPELHGAVRLLMSHTLKFENKVLPVQESQDITEYLAEKGPTL